jgi:membrane associated rhomboid family serine protease
MLPVQDVIPSRTMPWATLALIAALAVIAVAGLVLPGVGEQMILSYGAVPAHFHWTAALTSPFLHYGAIDALAHIWALWLFGDNVEDRMGHGRFVVFALLCGVLAVAAVVSLFPFVSIPVAGAGGMAGGVIGAYVVLLPSARMLVAVPDRRGIDLVDVPAPIMIGFWLLAGAAAGVRYTAAETAVPPTLVVQMAGLAAGAAGARVFSRSNRLRCEWWNVPSRQMPPVRRRTSRDTSASSVSSTSS